jgi:dTDP-4-amino-4,6-dideoxygalactose transaminase
VGSRYVDASARPPHGRMAGALSDVGTFSFFSNKNMAVGEGGMVTTDRDDLAERLRHYRSHGMTTLTWDRHKGHACSYDVILNGFNYRMDEIRAALGRAQLAKLMRNNRRRAELVCLYRGEFAHFHGWQAIFDNYPGESAYHLMAAVAPDAETRTRTAQALSQAGIQTSMHYPCITTFQAFGAYAAAEVPLSLEYARRAITLPLYPTMTKAQVQEVCAAVKQV